MGTNPPLQGTQLLATQIELVSSTTAAGTLFGIGFALYCLYLHALLPQLWNHERRRQAQFMMTYSSIIMTCASYSLVFNAWSIQAAYIKHSDFPGGPVNYEILVLYTKPVIIVGMVCQLAVDILTAAIQIWRVWVLWSGTRYARHVFVLPSLSLLCFTALQITLIVLESMHPDASWIQGKGKELATTVFALRAATIILPTILIAGFLTLESRRQCKLIGTSQVSSPYMSVVALLVESYGLESTWTVVFVILYYIRHPVELFFNDTLLYIEVIASLLVLYRLGSAARGAYGGQRTHGPQVECQDNMSSVHWNPTGTQSCPTEGIDTDNHPSGNQDILQGRGSPDSSV